MVTKKAKSSPGKPLTPLWVISLFLSLTETVLGFAVTQTSGGIQVALTTFVIVFPLLVAGGFFAVLWNRPYVFYSPYEYGQQDVREYVEAMQRKPLDEGQLYSTIQSTIRTTLSSEEIVNELTETLSSKAGKQIGKQVEDEVARILTSAADKTIETIREESFLTIDSRPLVGNDGQIWQIPYDRYNIVSELLDNLWFLLEPYGVPSMQYGVTWMLRDTSSKKTFKNMGRKFAEKFDTPLDTRSLEEVDIVPGMRLEAIPIPFSES
jgi:hypothetical protein